MFCSKCGTKLEDTAKFCSACGSPVTVPSPAPIETEPSPAPAQFIPDNTQDTADSRIYSSPSPEPPVLESTLSNEQLYSTPSIEPAASKDQLYSTPSTNPVVREDEAVPAMNLNPFSPQTPENRQNTETQPDNQDFAGQGFVNQQNTDTQFTNGQFMGQQYAAQQPAGQQYAAQQFAAQQPMGQQYAAGQPAAQQFAGQTYAAGGSTSYGYQQPQYPNNAGGPVYDNGMAAQSGNAQNWGPLMPPKKKSKAPIIITLSVITLLIAVAVVVCCLIFCGKKDGASSAKDALTNTLDALADNDEGAIFENMHPLYNTLLDALEDVDSEYKEAASLLSTYLKENMIEAMSPSAGEKFKYSDLKIDDEETLPKDEIDEYNENIQTQFDTYTSEFDAVGLDIGKVEDYFAEAAVSYEGTLTVKVSGDDEMECDFEAIVVKIDGNWYIATMSVY